MKTVLLAGGFGTRISEASQVKPKPMVEIGGRPILWHIMKGYSYFGFNDFIICAGYLQHVIKQWFSNYYLYTSDVTFDFSQANQMTVHNKHAEDWRVTIVDTGLNTMTGGRIKRVQPYIGDEPFLLTYGDAVCDVDIQKTVAFHQAHGKLATLTSVVLEQQKGVLEIGGDNAVHSFREKQSSDGAAINAGYMVCQPEVFSYIEGDSTVFERETLPRLAAEGELMSYSHEGFWQCMDTRREMDMLEKYWDTGSAAMEGVEHMNAGYLSYFRGKRVLITGHTGFKGSWLCRLLVTLGAEVTGYSLVPPTEPNLFTLACIAGTVSRYPWGCA